MKKLLKANSPPSEIDTADKDEKKSKHDFTYTDLVDILRQIEELKNYNIAIRIEEGMLQLAISDAVYEISEAKDKRYPRRRLRKLDT
jgi:hypothetical protein